MLKSRIAVDLPSVESNRRMGPVEWVRSLFGAKIDLRSGKEELTVGAFSLVEGLIAGFAKAGVDDALSFLVDKKVVYLDTNDVAHDLPLIVKAAETTGILDAPFKEMHLVLAHKDASLHTILDCEIASKVVLGQAEMEVVLSSRLLELQIRTGETAEAYAERVKGFAASEASFEPARRQLDTLTQRVADALRATLVGAKVTTKDAVVEVIRPDARQIGKFGQLGFGDAVQAPQYRAVPTPQRAGAYADPFYYYYYDPYYDYMNYVLVDAMIHDSMWHSHYVHVYDPGGSLLFTGDNAASYANDGWIGHSAIDYDSSGNLQLDSSVSSASDGGGSWWDSVGSGSDSSPGSSCASSSSCSSSSSCASSSSCSSSSSCGSSCSSGSSCGSSCSSS